VCRRHLIVPPGRAAGCAPRHCGDRYRSVGQTPGSVLNSGFRGRLSCDSRLPNRGGLDAEATFLAQRYRVAANRVSVAKGSARRPSGRRSADHQRDPPHAALWRSLAGLSPRIRSVHNNLQSLQPLEPPGNLASDVPGGHGQRRHHKHSFNRQFARQSAPFRSRRKGGSSKKRSGDRAEAARPRSTR
jgi:hypothetical protein